MVVVVVEVVVAVAAQAVLVLKSSVILKTVPKICLKLGYILQWGL